MIIKIELPDKKYTGKKNWKVYVDGKELQEVTPQKNEVGYSWGYAGNGSHHLAKALVLNHFSYIEPNHPDPCKDNEYFDFIANISSWIAEKILYNYNQHIGWKLSSSEIQKMIFKYKKSLRFNRALREKLEKASPYFKAL